jgi:hypothetical protein
MSIFKFLREKTLEDRIESYLDTPKTVLDLCGLLPDIKNEFKIMRSIANLEYENKVRLIGFDKIYREDGGAIYLAKYQKV